MLFDFLCDSESLSNDCISCTEFKDIFAWGFTVWNSLGVLHNFNDMLCVFVVHTITTICEHYENDNINIIEAHTNALLNEVAQEEVDGYNILPCCVC